MYAKHFRTALIVPTAALFMFMASVAHAVPSVLAGFDLLQTQPGTSLDTGLLSPPLPLGVIPLEGVPLESFDFGGATGIQSTGNTDTIIQRLGDADVPGAPNSTTIDIEIVALQLKSVAPVDLSPVGQPDNFIYVTLQTQRLPSEGSVLPAPGASLGQMTINFADNNGGTFDSFFDVFFDIRLGALDGDIVFSANKLFETAGVEWDRLPEPGAILIDGINHFLAGSGDPFGDFFPGPIVELSPVDEENTVHNVKTATIPEPATSLLLLTGLLGIGVLRHRKSV